MKFMKIILIVFVGMSMTAQAQEVENKNAVEVAVSSLNQDSGGNVISGMIAYDRSFAQLGPVSFAAQVGVSGYKDANLDKTFAVGLLRLLPGYRFAESAFSVQAIIGAQAWDSRGSAADLGARVKYDLHALAMPFASEAYFEAGQVQLSSEVKYATLGWQLNFP